jgi:cytochrome c oxidase subunit 3
MSQAITPHDAHKHGHGHDDDHAHDPNLAHHFETMSQQVASGKLGMWVFLATELLMFGGLFCAYAVWRARHYEAFELGHLYLDTFWGAFNTVVLITSSFTMAWAVRTAQLGKKNATVVLLFLTLLGAAGFMCVKYVEYSHKYHIGLFIGPMGQWEKFREEANQKRLQEQAQALTVLTTSPVPLPGPAPTGLAVMEAKPLHEAAGPHAPQIIPQGGLDPHAAPDAHGGHAVDPTEASVARTFFSIYFLMTGLHGFHVLVGMFLIAWVMIRAAKGHFTPSYNAPVDLVGLYWHLVDLIWIFLFPLLYLIK